MRLSCASSFWGTPSIVDSRCASLHRGRIRIRSIAVVSFASASLLAVFAACTGDSPVTSTEGPDAATDAHVGTDGTTPGPDGGTQIDSGGDNDAATPDAGVDAGPITTQLGSRLVLWLVADKDFSADGVNALVWKDQSGQGNDATQATVAYQPPFFDGGNGGINGHGVVHFSNTAPAQQFVEIADTTQLQWAASDYLLFAVERHTNDVAHYSFVYSKFEVPNPFAGPILWASYPNETYPATTGYVTRLAAGNAEVLSDGGYNDNTMRVVGMRRAGSDLQLHISGTMVSDYPDSSIPDEAGFNAVGQPAFVGGRPDGIQQLNGDIAEIIAVKGTVSESELAQIQAYLKAKYGL